MKHTLKKTIAGLSVLTTVVVLTGCSNPSDAPSVGTSEGVGKNTSTFRAGQARSVVDTVTRAS